MADPITLALLGTGLLKGLFGGLSKKKQASAQGAADQRKYAAEKSFWDANEAERSQQRRARVDTTGSILRSLQGAARPGTPDYTIDPALLEKLGTATPRPFAGSLPADPKAGAGMSLMSGLFGDASEALGTILLGKKLEEGGGDVQSMPIGPNFKGMLPNLPNPGSTVPPVPLGGGMPGVSGGANAAICAQFPHFPGCPGGSMGSPEQR